MHDADQVFNFREGLKDRRIANKLIERKPVTLDDAIQEAVTWDQVFSSSARVSSAYSNAFRSNGSGNAVQSRASSSSVPMELGAVSGHEEADGVVPSGDGASSSSHQSTNGESQLFAIVEKLSQQVAALSARDSSAARHEPNRISGLKPGDIDRCRQEGRCFNCKEKGHSKRDCRNQFRLNW